MGQEARPLVDPQELAADSLDPMALSIECGCDRLNPGILGWASRSRGDHIGRRSKDRKAPSPRRSCRTYLSDLIELNEFDVVTFWRLDQAFVMRASCRRHLPGSRPGLVLPVIHPTIISHGSVEHSRPGGRDSFCRPFLIADRVTSPS